MASTDKFCWDSGDVHWLSPVGELDDFGNPIHDQFVDGQTRIGGWAIMSPDCHRALGVGLGLGLGQLYTRQSDGTWLRTEG